MTSNRQLERRHRVSRLGIRLFQLCAAAGVFFLVILMAVLLTRGLAWVSLDFLTALPSSLEPHQSGVWQALAGTLWLMAMTVLFTIPLGVGAAVYLEEYPGIPAWNRMIEVNIANLAGVPSIVYGILGLAVFNRLLGFGPSVLAGALTLTLLLLPVVITASREALKAVPVSLREGAAALGATRWQTIWYHVLPVAAPGILTGVILSISRAIGETAPILLVGAVGYMTFTPNGPLSEFTALPLQIYDWSKRPQEVYHGLAAGAILVLLVLMLLMNAAAIWLRTWTERKLQ